MKKNKKWLNLMNISLIVGILGVVITAVYYYIEVLKPSMFPEPSFVVNIDSLEDTIPQRGILQHTITVKNLNGYDQYNVSLSARLKSGHLPEGITLKFQAPEGGPKPTYTSNLLISAEDDVPVGKYDLIIEGLGSTGYETNCSFTLNVVPASKTVSSSNTINSEPECTVPIPVEGNFFPSGWMGDRDDLTLDVASMENPHSKDTCIKVDYSAKKSQGNGWAGVYWQYPDKNWGEKRGYNWSKKGLSKLTFWAKGEGTVTFKVGGIKDEVPASSGAVVLENAWKEYEISLNGKDLS
ncbi:MAG: hypothetical protein N2Z65_07765, partial [Clostridiales bacterium]|nr:hypothetical protein [Clostridiales bacterium]